MRPDLFLNDLEMIPAFLERLADELGSGRTIWPVARPRRILLVGMGSSYFAASVIAHRLRSLDLDAVAERASMTTGWPSSPDLLIVAISASGRSLETLAAVEPYIGSSHVVALTNDPESPLARRTDQVVEMFAGVEAGGVACRTYRHTIATLLGLTGQLTTPTPLGETLRRAAEASSDLLACRGDWLSEVDGLLDCDQGSWFLAPVERLSSAQQAALMVREGPRRRADACETGDWSHVDVYLTKTLDYRALVFSGSRWDAAAAEWLTDRGATVVSVGGSFPDAHLDVRYVHDDDPDVALLTEVLIAEMLAATWWLREGASDGPGSKFVL